MAVSQKYTAVSLLTATNATANEALNLSTNQYKAVNYSSDGCTLTFASNASPIGVLVNSPTTNQVSAVAVAGVVQFRMAASTISAGGQVAASTNGLGIAPSSDSPMIGQVIYGTSGAAGRLVTINLSGAQWGSTF